MAETETSRKEKKTNYQRLWRISKKQEVLSHNFAEDVVQVSKNFLSKSFSDEELDKKIESFDKAIQLLRDRYTEAAVKI